jgi:hypothetical protein
MEELAELAMYLIASAIVVVAIVGTKVWLRGRRLREAYRETRRDGNANPKMGQRTDGRYSQTQ